MMEQGSIEIREMRKEEASLACKTGKACFSLVEGLAMKNPKQAFLAFSDYELVGMASYRTFSARDNQKIGYVEVGYVKKGFEGKGIGGILYQKATLRLKEQGCETVTATVKDDNVASWKLFEQNGYHITGFGQMLENYGFLGTINLWFQSTLAFGTGFHLWSTIPKRERSPAQQIGIFAVLNLLALLAVFVLERDLMDAVRKIGAGIVLLTVSLLGGFLATVRSREAWCFRTTRGGLLVSLLVTAIGGIWPVVGRFYPKEYKRTAKFRRDMGLEGLFEWAAILICIMIAAALEGQWLFLKYITSAGTTRLLFHSLPVYPFECYGGGRIWAYHKVISLLTMGVSGGLLLLL